MGNFIFSALYKINEMYMHLFDCNVQFLMFKCVRHCSSNFAMMASKINLMQGGALRFL